MECWRTGVQLPPPPPNTGGSLDHSRPLETSVYKGSGNSPLFPNVVSDGCKWSPVGHNYGTNGTDWAHNSTPSIQAFLRTKHLGTDDCQLFRKNIFEAHPQLALSMASSYLEIAKQKGYINANQNLLAVPSAVRLDFGRCKFLYFLKKVPFNKALFRQS